jgi:ABC-type protease/lipase transport system fused ATPase/permease subunit
MRSPQEAMIFGTSRLINLDLAAALRECRSAFGTVALFSGIVNLLMLAGPLYILQIYDRVLSSRSVPTLVALSIFWSAPMGSRAPSI